MKLRTKLNWGLLGTLVLGLAWFLAGWRVQLASFAKHAHQAEEVIIHEGLPHASWESEYVAEKARADLQTIHGYPFYQEALSPDPADATALREIVTQKPLFTMWLGPKLCGDYHPDYAVEWRSPRGSVYALVCLGCDEVKFSSTFGWGYCEIPRSTLEPLAGVLVKYQKNRPRTPQSEARRAAYLPEPVAAP